MFWESSWCSILNIFLTWKIQGRPVIIILIFTSLIFNVGLKGVSYLALLMKKIPWSCSIFSSFVSFWFVLWQFDKRIVKSASLIFSFTETFPFPSSSMVPATASACGVSRLPILWGGTLSKINHVRKQVFFVNRPYIFDVEFLVDIIH